jgi:acyl-CoA thioesterase
MEQEQIFMALENRVMAEPFARKFGLAPVRIATGYCLVKMPITSEIENIFGMAHGGAIYALIDEAFEIASNSHGTVALALGVNVQYIRPASAGDILYAEAREINRTSRISHYDIQVRNNEGDLIAVCKAMAYRKKDRLPFLEEAL